MTDLEHQFRLELEEKTHQAKAKYGYNPTRFNQMLTQYGAVETAKRLISSAMATGTVSEGFTKLYLWGRPDLTMEDSVCKEEYKSLFSPEEIAYCKSLLNRT